VPKSSQQTGYESADAWIDGFAVAGYSVGVGALLEALLSVAR